MMDYRSKPALVFLIIFVALESLLVPGNIAFTAGGGKNLKGRRGLQVRRDRTHYARKKETHQKMNWQNMKILEAGRLGKTAERN